MFRHVTIIGVGLLGGSVAMSIRRRLPDVKIAGCSRRESTLNAALEVGAIDEAFDEIDSRLRASDAVVVCTPVDRIARQVIQAAALTSDECLITDVGSTKAGIVREVGEDTSASEKFVAAHPIAGSEKTGVRNATASLFDGKVVLVTPAQTTPQSRLDQAHSFWGLTGARVISMTPDQHDDQLAAISHVPHLMSALVSKLTPESALPWVGSGWRDITRVAAGDPEMWTAICSENRQAILQQVRRYMDELGEVTRCLQDSDDEALHQWFAAARSIRHQADPQ
ncbi:MAG: prephenate dehydrogenase/arogenate dehydrogenase family protein [Planctomycetota bacterium]